MSAWRRKALALFPEHRADITRPDDLALNELFFRLVEDAEHAHASELTDPQAALALKRIHGFAEWCMHQGGDLWRKAAIGFYEDLFHTAPWEAIVPWLSPFAIEQVEATWALGVAGEHRPRLEQIVRERRVDKYREHVFGTREIETL